MPKRRPGALFGGGTAVTGQFLRPGRRVQKQDLTGGDRRDKIDR